MKFKLFKEPTFFPLELCVEVRQRIINILREDLND
jgi:hypothetical protein